MGRRPPAILLGDAPGLDFLNSIATPGDAPVDWIADGEGLVSWLADAKLVPADVLESIRANARPGEIDEIARQARALREDFRQFVRAHRGRSLTPADLDALQPLNRILARDEAFSRIVARDGGAAPFAIESARRWRTPESLLLPIAEALARFVCAEDFANVKSCEGSACTLLFADRTRGRARRWCSMAVCGNRAKQAAHRERRKAQARATR